jgi:tetratricopeptide (TPR) repeat protein
MFGRPKRCALVSLCLLLGLGLAACSSAAQRAQNYYENGQKLVAAHDDQRAALEFKNAIQLKKDMLPAWRALADIDERHHNFTELVPVLRGIVDLDPKDVDTKLKLARLMLFGKAPDEALKLVNSIDQTASPNAEVLALKAAIFYQLKDQDGAQREAQSALKINPGSVDALIVLAAVRLENNDANGALAILNSDPIAHNNEIGVELFKIRAFEKLGNSPQVEAVLQKLIALYPKEIAFHKQLARFYIDQHRLDDAEKQLRLIAAADPKNSAAQLDVVRFLFATKGAAAARAELVSHISAGGDVFAYQMALADFDFAQGNDTDSFKLLQTLAANASAPDHAMAAKVKLAEMNLARKNIDAADTLVTDILNTDSRNIDGLRLRAVIHMDRDQLEPAISDLRSALNDQPRSTPLMLLLASAYERSGSIELAGKEFADAMRLSNYDPNVGLNYVAFLRRRGSTQRAEDVLTDLDTRHPKNLAILSALAEVKLTLQDWAGAQEIAETIKQLNNSGIADQILGAALGGEHKPDQSIAALQSAVAAQPTAVQPMVALVAELMRAKQSDRAIAFLQTVLKTNPANAEALVLLGSIQLTNNTPDQAIASFNSAIAKQSKDVIGYRALADFYVRQKNNDAALKVIQAGLKEMPDNVTLHMSMAGIFELNQNYDGAISEYQYVLTQQPGSLIAANNLASMLADHRTDKASLDQAQTLAASLRSSPVPQFKDTLGWVDYRQGDYKAATPLLEAAASALSESPLIHYHLGMAYEASGQMAKAAEQFKAALGKAPDNVLAEKIRTELKKTATE